MKNPLSMKNIQIRNATRDEKEDMPQHTGKEPLKEAFLASGVNLIGRASERACCRYDPAVTRVPGRTIAFAESMITEERNQSPVSSANLSDLARKRTCIPTAIRQA
jgi:hypothetical protein